MHWDEDEFSYGERDELESWQTERIDFNSIGIDIGSSTSHLMTSRLVLRRRGKEYYSGYTVVERKITYASPIIFTPYLSSNTIDTVKLSEFINRCYEEAGITPDIIDTGAVITTGEAAKKENAANIINLFARQAGKFVTAVAGPNLESTLAAHGSGAVRRTNRHGEGGYHPVIMNVDIGGGTAKIAIVQEGRVRETGAVNVGSRLVAWDEKGSLIRIEETGGALAKSLGFHLVIGDTLRAEQKEALAERMADVLVNVMKNVIKGTPLTPLAEQLMITPNLTYHGPVDLIIYSGGVSEYIYDQSKVSFYDLGDVLGRYVRKASENLGLRVESGEQRIRATVIGASQYTVQVSGNTIYLSDKNILPIRNLPVVNVNATHKPLTKSLVVEEVQRGFRLLDLEEGVQLNAIAVQWDQEPSYALVSELCAGLIQALPCTLAKSLPVILIFDGDVAGLIGHHLRDLGLDNCPIVSLDSIDLRGLNFIDIGEELEHTKAVPVTVKSLVFK